MTIYRKYVDAIINVNEWPTVSGACLPENAFSKAKYLKITQQLRIESNISIKTKRWKKRCFPPQCGTMTLQVFLAYAECEFVLINVNVNINYQATDEHCHQVHLSFELLPTDRSTDRPTINNSLSSRTCHSLKQQKGHMITTYTLICINKH